MFHIVRLIQRRFPDRSGQVIGGLALVSFTLLAVGLGFLLFR